jgi:hypothetical protein
LSSGSSLKATKIAPRRRWSFFGLLSLIMSTGLTNLQRRARTGETGPEPVPDPHEVIINRRTGDVIINGSVLLEEKQAMDALIAGFPDHMRNLGDIE